MSKDTRCNEILSIIRKSGVPVSGTELAKQFGVSRQVIVQDIALLRASNYDIISTNRGYILNSPKSCQRIFKVCHSDEQIEDELTTIVDYGGTIVDVFIKHKVYGEFRAMLSISSKRDVLQFIKSLENGLAMPLKNVTQDNHYHTVEAQSEEILNEIEEALKAKKYIIN